MRWDREQWRKLYLREPVEQALWPLLTRGLRDYLIRRADDSGRLFAATTDPSADLSQALGARDTERDIVRDSVREMLKDGFLVLGTDGGLFVRNLRDAQERRSKEAVRKARQRQKKVDAVAADAAGGTRSGTPRDIRAGQSRDISVDPIRSDPIRSPVVPTGDTPALRIFGELKGHESLASVASQEFADVLAKRFATIELARGAKLDWILLAIGQAAADCAGQPGLATREKAKLVRTYCDNARAPKPNGNGRDQPKTYDSPKATDEEIAAFRNRKMADLAKLEAELAKEDSPHDPS